MSVAYPRYKSKGSSKNKVTIYKNKDKKRFKSHWVNQTKNYWDTPLGNKILLIGSSGTGKTNNVRNILEKSKKIHKAYLITPDTNKEYDFLGKRLRKYTTKKPPKFENICKNKYNVVIIDDIDILSEDKKFQTFVKELFTHVSSHNGVRVFLSTHNYASVPTTIRRCSSLMFIHQSPDMHIIKQQIFQKLGAKPKEVDLLYDLMKSHYDCIVIDLIPGSTSKYRLNNVEPIDLKNI